MFGKRMLGLTIMVSILLSACASQPNIRQQIVGKWFCPMQWNERDNHIYEFTASGRITVWGDGITGDGKQGTYQFVDDSHIAIDFPASQYGPRIVDTGRVDVTGDKLIMWSKDETNAFPCNRMQ